MHQWGALNVSDSFHIICSFYLGGVKLGLKIHIWRGWAIHSNSRHLVRNQKLDFEKFFLCIFFFTLTSSFLLFLFCWHIGQWLIFRGSGLFLPNTFIGSIDIISNMTCSFVLFKIHGQKLFRKTCIILNFIDIMAQQESAINVYWASLSFSHSHTLACLECRSALIIINYGECHSFSPLGLMRHFIGTIFERILNN